MKLLNKMNTRMGLDDLSDARAGLLLAAFTAVIIAGLAFASKVVVPLAMLAVILLLTVDTIEMLKYNKNGDEALEVTSAVTRERKHTKFDS